MTRKEEREIHIEMAEGGRVGPFLWGFLSGTAFMYLFEDRDARRHRSLLRDKAVRMEHELESVVDKGIRDLRHRVRGLVAEARARLREEVVDDTVLVERVRAELGRFVSHPGSIDVTAQRGHVRLSGPILAEEVEPLLRRIKKVRGVKSVESNLEIHPSRDHVPGLQGAGRRPGRRPDFLQENWSPATRLVVGGIAGLVALEGFARRGVLGSLAAGVGSSLFLRAATNLPARRLFGIGAGRRAVDVHKTIEVHAPIEEVFAFLTHPENFPRFMEHVESVKVGKDGVTHWRVVGPAGHFEWDAIPTRVEPNKVFAWKTLPDQTVEHAGIIHFEKTPSGGTRLDIRMSYNPPLGAIGHFIASLFGKDPKHALDDDLVRLKSLLEHGKATAHGQTVRKEELVAGFHAEQERMLPRESVTGLPRPEEIH